jgi:hypothetical protein
MTVNQPHPREAPWKTTATYLKAASFLAPPLLIWTAITIFIAPKIKQICADSGAGPFTAFQVMDFAQDNALTLTVAAVAIIILLEWKSALWRRWRKYTLGTAVFLINTAVILGLASLLLIAALAAPIMANR